MDIYEQVDCVIFLRKYIGNIVSETDRNFNKTAYLQEFEQTKNMWIEFIQKNIDKKDIILRNQLALNFEIGNLINVIREESHKESWKDFIVELNKNFPNLTDIAILAYKLTGNFVRPDVIKKMQLFKEIKITPIQS